MQKPVGNGIVVTVVLKRIWSAAVVADSGTDG